jgi:hypothetical protein
MKLIQYMYYNHLFFFRGEKKLFHFLYSAIISLTFMLMVSARKWVCLVCSGSVTGTRTAYLLQWQGSHNIHPLFRSQTLSALCPELTGGCDHRSAQETYSTLIFQSRCSKGRQLQSCWPMSSVSILNIHEGLGILSTLAFWRLVSIIWTWFIDLFFSYCWSTAPGPTILVCVCVHACVYEPG